jgi:hypothetical protein
MVSGRLFAWAQTSPPGAIPRRCSVHGINTARVVIGGVVAGLVLNVSEFILNMVVLGADMKAAMARLNLPPVEDRGMVRTG